ncbi:hypothetical protein D6B99_04285 [Arachidicoccus soli]|uniref:Uncharacterized protein n=1 Tax=Arachidicoccus soli TaxID=2341117 RepID=A0A386HN02_9BACT|nr:hypothetical protein D6B99_04285 [Arachidicoccus soli]
MSNYSGVGCIRILHLFLLYLRSKYKIHRSKGVHKRAREHLAFTGEQWMSCHFYGGNLRYFTA